MVSTSERRLTNSSLARAWKATPRFFLRRPQVERLPQDLLYDQLARHFFVAQSAEY
jgi:hypothetical protein